MSEKTLLQGRTALVTGASKLGGIGAAIAKCYAEHGANLVLAARNEQGLKEVAQQCEEAANGNGWVRTETCDMTKPDQIDALAKNIIEKHGGVDILAANAGTSLGGSDVLKGDPNGWDTTVDINLAAPMRLTRLLAPEMARKGGGACIFTGSLAGVRPTKTAAYAASKYAIRAWAQACYEELRPHSIVVSCLEPGYVDTPMVKDVQGDHSLFIQPSDLAEAALLPFKMKSATPLEIVLRLGYPVD